MDSAFAQPIVKVNFSYAKHGLEHLNRKGNQIAGNFAMQGKEQMTGCKEYETQVDSYADPPPPSLAIPSTGSRHTAERRLPPPGDHQGLPPPDPAASQHERRCRLRLRSRRCCHRRWRGGREGGGGRPGPVRGAAARPGGRVAAGERRGSGLPRRRGCRVGAPGPPGHRCLLRARQPRPNAQGNTGGERRDTAKEPVRETGSSWCPAQAVDRAA